VTTVAWDGKSVSADGLMDGWQQADKVFLLRDGRIMAGAGYLDQILEIVAWFNDGCRPQDKPDLPDDDGSSLLLIDGPDGYSVTWPYLRLLKIKDGFAAVGSGAGYALGAMAAGKGSRAAVEIAARFDPFTGGEITTVRPKVRK
jgi:hypothetical protein